MKQHEKANVRARKEIEKVMKDEVRGHCPPMPYHDWGWTFGMYVTS